MKKKVQALTLALAIIGGGCEIEAQNYIERIKNDTLSSIVQDFLPRKDSIGYEGFEGINIFERPRQGGKVKLQKVDTVDSKVKIEKKDSIGNLSFNQNYDSLCNISQRIEELLRKEDEGHLDKFYGQDKYIELTNKLKQEFINKVRELNSNDSIYKLGEKEFDQKMDTIKQRIIQNPDRYGKFDSKGNYSINKSEYENLLKEVFPEFFSLYGENTDIYSCLWNKEISINEYYGNPNYRAGKIAVRIMAFLLGSLVGALFFAAVENG